MAELKKVKASEKILTGQLVIMFYDEEQDEHLAKLYHSESYANGFANHDVEKGEYVTISTSI